ncbi:sigma 54-interacting transcriptional regulator [Sorangium sp. So ce1504]|uniref:sigma 54-interacting transcriptional regulator n=1 Tax=Sorangium sp. So ce1504 TaxID=3133337 RepID=UPI003F636924
MKKADQILRAVAAKDVTLTLIGESGSGKGVLARRAHELSERRQGPFVPINCAAIPDALFESELFGHERGAFTGASERAKGKVEAAERRMLLLDEIGEMPMQAKLLRFLENRRYMRVGGATKIEAVVPEEAAAGVSRASTSLALDLDDGLESLIQRSSRRHWSAMGATRSRRRRDFGSA